MKKRIAIITGASGGLGKEFGDKIVTLSFDLSKQESITSISEILDKEQPRIVYLINSAGTGEELSPSKEFTVEKNYETI